MKILISGSTGLIGSALVARLRLEGHEVVRLVRGKGVGAAVGTGAAAGSAAAGTEAPGRGAGEIPWDPVAGRIDPVGLEGLDAAIHLSGRNIASGLWTSREKRRLWVSRIGSTDLLARTLAGLDARPRLLLSASAIGIYGDRGEEVLTEESPPGRGFLAELGLTWEAALEPARRAGIRTVPLRFGLVLSPRGGVLGRMRPAFSLGIGAVLGDGRQIMSWVSLEDVLGIVRTLLDHEAIDGPVNVVAPNPVTNRDFTYALGRALSRPTLLRIPVPVVRAMFGEMGRETLLSSGRVSPARLEALGYEFTHPRLEDALAACVA